MALVDYSAFLPLIRPEVRDCMDAVILDAVRRAASRFCAETWIIESNVGVIGTAKGIAEYSVNTPSQKAIIEISGITGPHGELDKALASNLDGIDRNWRDREGQPTHWIGMTTRKVRFYPSPLASGIYEVRAFLKPTLDASGIDDWVFDDFHEGIAAGAKAELAAMPRKAWTNFELVPYYRAIFDDAVSNARLKRASSFSGVSMRVQPVRFGG